MVSSSALDTVQLVIAICRSTHDSFSSTTTTPALTILFACRPSLTHYARAVVCTQRGSISSSRTFSLDRPALKLRYATSTFQPRLSWPTMVSRRADRGVENVCRMGGAGFQGAQTILMSSLLDTHRAIFFPPICIIEPPQLTEHTLWPLAQRAKGTHRHPYDHQPLIRVSQQPAYFCSSCVPSSSPWDLAASEDL